MTIIFRDQCVLWLLHVSQPGAEGAQRVKSMTVRAVTSHQSVLFGPEPPSCKHNCFPFPTWRRSLTKPDRANLAFAIPAPLPPSPR